MMQGLIKSTVVAASVIAIFVQQASAVDFSGVWATDGDQCKKVFVKKGRTQQIGFTAISEQHGGGFIAEGDRLKGKFATCKIKKRKDDGQNVVLIAGCATDIMLSNVEFNLKMLEPDKLARVFPSIEGMEITYYRCTL
jgi:hypothetical protein